ncbi:MAG: 5-formyltetrahydrofolate cyclo-ligase [Acidiferrobacterales bacterium]|nr:5-formyltetrahydrofolate cyclo-ligase [Acidiferrobacterales bacterium]
MLHPDPDTVTSKYTKPELRRVMRARRAELSPDQQLRAAVRLAVHVVATPWFRASRRVACYLPINGEIDTRPVIERIWDANKVCYLPVVPDRADKPLLFAALRPDTLLAANRFGIPEPLAHRRDLVRARDLDLILLPLVSFDNTGNRLGMGSGFYDRTLTFLCHRSHWKKPFAVGLAHEFQRAQAFTTDPWDVPLTAVVTEKGAYSF